MKLKDFGLERWFAEYEFTVSHLLSSSDCETMSIGELLDAKANIRAGFDALRLGYTESRGDVRLRERIASLYATVDSDDVLVFNGAEEAIFAFLNTVLNAGDHVIVQWPCYQSLYEIALSAGCNVSCWSVSEDDCWKPDIGNLVDLLQNDTKAVIINSPHNPTGFHMDGTSWSELGELADKRGFLVLSDEVYRYLEYDDSDILSAFCDMNEHGVSIGVMSKSFGLAGLRIGWAVTHDQAVYKAMESYKDYTTICCSAPAEYLSTLAIDRKDDILTRNRSIVTSNLNLLTMFIDNHEELFSWVKPVAGPVAFPQLNVDANVDSFCRTLAEKAGILLLPGSVFGAEFERHVRFGFGRCDFPEALEAFEGYLQTFNL